MTDQKVYLKVISAILCRECVDKGHPGEDLNIGVTEDGCLAISCGEHGDDMVLVFKTGPGVVTDEQLTSRRTDAVKKQ